MLKKIFKHEFAETGKILWLLYGISFGTSLITVLIMCVSPDNGFGTLMYGGAFSLYLLVLMATFFGSFIMLVYRFTVSMAGRESYFTYTLPAKNSSHLLARLYITMIYTFISSVLLIIQIGLLIIGTTAFGSGFSAVGNMFAAITDPGLFVSIAFLILMFIFVAMLLSTIQMFAAVALGTYFSKNRVLGTIVAMFIFSAISNVISVIAMIPFIFLINNIGEAIAAFISGFDTLSGMVSGTLWLIFLIYFVISALYGTAYYIYTHITLSKKLRGTDS